jgi:hypothetical protein
MAHCGDLEMVSKTIGGEIVDGGVDRWLPE